MYAGSPSRTYDWNSCRANTFSSIWVIFDCSVLIILSKTSGLFDESGEEPAIYHNVKQIESME